MGIELRPGLIVNISDSEYDCLRGRVETWEIISQGLMDVGQKELWISVAKPPGRPLDEVAGPLFEFLRVVHQVAQQGKTVDVGGVTTLSPESSPLLEGSEFRAALYTYPIGMGTDESAMKGGLSMICLTHEELEIASEYGHTRFLSALGNYYRYFPTPPWADANRPQVLSRNVLEASIIPKFMRVSMYRSSTVVEADESDRRLAGHTGHLPDHSSSWIPGRVRLSVHPEERSALVEALDISEGKTPITVLTSIKPGITRSMVWTEPEAPMQVISDMNAGGSAIGCNFTMLASEQDETGSLTVEDGQLVQLTQAQWKDLDKAIREGSPFSLKGEGELADFELAFRDGL